MFFIRGTIVFLWFSQILGAMVNDGFDSEKET